MCGRMTLKTLPAEWSQLLLPLCQADQEQVDTVLAQWKPRYNIAPTQSILAVVPTGQEELIGIDYLRWGLVPGWADDLAIGSRMINARAETLPEKRSFSGPLEKKRCLVIADGYYEWQKLPSGKKQPYWISPAKGGVVLLAGLWETNRKATGQPVRSCAIVTTAANKALSGIHDRMPVALEKEVAARWMDTRDNSLSAHELLGPADDSYFRTRQISTYVNNVRHEGGQCIKSVESEELF